MLECGLQRFGPFGRGEDGPVVGPLVADVDHA